MDPILRRSSFFYVTALITYMGLMGRFMLTRDWPAFEVIPLFLPVWLISGMAASEHDERYAFLRMLPVPDRTVARMKFILVLSAIARDNACVPLDGGGAMANIRRTTRREFLAAGASGVAGAAWLAACSRSRTPDTENAVSSTLVTRTLGRTGLKLPVVSIGSAYEAGLVSAALDAGLTYVHTSGSYADQNHERMLSRVFRGRPRESFVVGSSPDFPEYRVVGGGLSEDLGTRADASTIAPFLRRQPAAPRPRAPRHLLPRVDQRSRNRAARAVHEGVRGSSARGRSALPASRRIATSRPSSGRPRRAASGTSC